MDMLVGNKVAGCHACQATVKQEHRDPLQPTTAPDCPWEKVAADHWGPTPDKQGIDDGEELYNRRVFMSDLPDAVTVDMLREVAERDPSYVMLADLAGKKDREPSHQPLHNYNYTSVCTEPGVVDKQVCRRDRIVVPSADLAENTGNINT